MASKSPQLYFSTTEEVKAKLKTLAKQRSKDDGNRVLVTDLIREAVEEYLIKHDIEIDVTSVNRGGDRIDRTK